MVTHRSRERRSASPARRGRGDEPIRITTAAAAREEDIASRQRRYLVAMALRSVCFVGAVVAGAVFELLWLTGILLAGAIFLPYVAVVMANAASSRDDGFELPDHAYRPELPGPPEEP